MTQNKKRVRFTENESDHSDTKKPKMEIDPNTVLLQFCCPVTDIDTSNTDKTYLETQVNRMIAKILFYLHDELHKKVSSSHSICIARKAYEFSFINNVLFDSVFIDSFADNKDEYNRVHLEMKTLIEICQKNKDNFKKHIESFMQDMINEEQLKWVCNYAILENRLLKYLKYLSGVLPDDKIINTSPILNQENLYSYQIPLKVIWQRPQFLEETEPDFIEKDVNDVIIKTLYTISGRAPVQFKHIFREKISQYIL